MFESFKKKISNWLGKSEEKKEEPKPEATIKSVKIEKPAKQKKKDKKQKEQKLEEKPAEETKTKIKESEIEQPEPLPEIKEVKEEANIEIIKETPEDKIEPEKKKDKKWWQFRKKKEEKQEAEKLEELKEEIKETIEKVTEEVKEQPEQVEEKKEYGFFAKLMKKVSPITTTLDQKHVDEIFSELEMILLENNVALEVVDKIKANLYKDLIGIEIKRDKIESTIIQSLNDSILQVLIEPPNLINQIKEKEIGPFTILFFGINGAGKTTAIAKIANMLKKEKISCVLAAGDTFRAASIEQLEKHANKLDVPIIKSTYGSDPASVAFDAIKYAEKNKIKAVLIDTAGRMYTKTNLLKEMEKIVRVSKPDLKIFVGESITGNDATEQAKTFNESIGIDGIILSKADVDEKAGTILSVSYVTNKPIYFLGIGQNYEDLKPFTKSDVLKNIGLNN